MRDILTLRSPKPLPEVVPVLEFKKFYLPYALKDYVYDVSKRQKCPLDFVAVSAMCALSALIGKKILVKPKKNDNWLITVNLWGALIGDPSSMKTPSMNAALLPIKEIENSIMKNFMDTERENEKQKRAINIKNKVITAEAQKICKNEGDQAMRLYLDENIVTPTLLKRKRLSINDTTYEKLGEILSENENGLLLTRDELSAWLIKIYKEEFQAERAFYLQCYNGNESYISDRIGRGTIFIKNAMISVIGGIQPSIISPLIENAKAGVSDDGLLQRLQLSVWPESIPLEWTDEKPDQEAYRCYRNIFYKFYELDSSTKIYSLDEKAQTIFKDFMENIYKLSNEDISPQLKSYILKLPKTIISLALIIQLSDNFETSLIKMQIESCAMSQAVLWCDYLISHAKKIYSSENNILISANLIIERFEKLPEEFTASSIKKKEWKGLSDKSFIEKVLETLVEYDWLIPRDETSTLSGGRPTRYYKKNFL